MVIKLFFFQEINKLSLIGRIIKTHLFHDQQENMLRVSIKPGNFLFLGNLISNRPKATLFIFLRFLRTRKIYDIYQPCANIKEMSNSL